MNIHFICRGNVLRSLIAETYLKSLKLSGVTVSSSGTVTDISREDDRPFFETTVRVLTAHGLQKYIKSNPDQLTQARANNQDITVVMNARAFSEANELVDLPEGTIVWDIIDIGEGLRTEKYENGREVEEVIYDEITSKVDDLVKTIRQQVILTK